MLLMFYLSASQGPNADCTTERLSEPGSLGCTMRDYSCGCSTPGSARNSACLRGKPRWPKAPAKQAQLEGRPEGGGLSINAAIHCYAGELHLGSGADTADSRQFRLK